jgi:hypothetical protein
MKKHLILISILFTTAFPALFAQTLEVGMRLEYIVTPLTWMPPLINQSMVSVEITGETMIQGEIWLQAQSDKPCIYDEPVLIREEGSRVYHYTNGGQYLLYDYSLIPGDTLWQTYPIWNALLSQYEMATYPIQIVDTSSIFLGGQWRKTQSIYYPSTLDYPHNDIGGPIIEGIGSPSYFFPVDLLCEAAICLRAIYWPNGDSTVVDTFTNCFIINSATEAAASQTLTLSPNPVQDMLYLHASQPLSPDAQVRVYDLYGRTVYRGLFSDAAQGISVAAWPAGVYVAEVWEGGRRLMARALVR